MTEPIADPAISARALLSIAAAYADFEKAPEARRAAAAAWTATAKVSDPEFRATDTGRRHVYEGKGVS